MNELLEEIQGRDVAARGLFTDFMDAHFDWSSFHEKNRIANRRADQAKLAEVVKRRDDTRAAIVKRMAELG